MRGTLFTILMSPYYSRESSVRTAAKGLVVTWLHLCGEPRKHEDGEGAIDPLRRVITFLKMFDLTKPEAAEALNSLSDALDALYKTAFDG